MRAIQIRDHGEMDTMCFFVLREDGTVDDFSYRKCGLRLHNVSV